ncbi:MAG: ABC transporter ATP-binding protein [Clostridia bacterium]|nr:ABC transporter ATP-binding protein [Clostridia bacterium]
MELLRTEHITKSYQDRVIIRDICIHLEEGELVSLLGLSGSGKTTLLNILSGLVTPDSGKVFLSGREITGKPGEISYMLQKDLLLEHKRVIDNVALPLVIRGMKKEEARAKASPYFREFDLEGTQMLYPAQLSGGMRQRAALLRTYLGSGGVILLDEPFSALDMITRGQLHAWYLDIRRKIGLSTILITHDADEAILLSDRIYLMTGSPGEIHHELRIEGPREDRQEFSLQPEFTAYKRQIRDILAEREMQAF